MTVSSACFSVAMIVRYKVQLSTHLSRLVQITSQGLLRLQSWRTNSVIGSTHCKRSDSGVPRASSLHGLRLAWQLPYVIIGARGDYILIGSKGIFPTWSSISMATTLHDHWCPVPGVTTSSVCDWEYLCFPTLCDCTVPSVSGTVCCC